MATPTLVFEPVTTGALLDALQSFGPAPNGGEACLGECSEGEAKAYEWSVRGPEGLQLGYIVFGDFVGERIATVEAEYQDVRGAWYCSELFAERSARGVADFLMHSVIKAVETLGIRGVYARPIPFDGEQDRVTERLLIRFYQRVGMRPAGDHYWVLPGADARS